MTANIHFFSFFIVFSHPLFLTLLVCMMQRMTSEERGFFFSRWDLGLTFFFLCYRVLM